MKKADIPLIFLFTHKENFYVYDTNRNKLMNVSKEIYTELHKLKNTGVSKYIKSKTCNTDSKQAVLQLIDKGYFLPSNLQKIEFPNKEYVPDLLNRNINKLILQITRDCNFNCRYCSFSGNGKYQRTHEKKQMNFSTVMSAIDMLQSNSVDSGKIFITFYGGEPFLEFDLIKKSIDYALSTLKSKDIFFNATINASILDEEIISYLEKVSFDLLISLDGPKDVHNENRRFRSNGQGTFDIIINNIKNLMKNHKAYFEDHVTFNAVLLSTNKFSEIENFFINNLGVSTQKVKVQYADLSGMDYLQDISNDLTTPSPETELTESALFDNLEDYSDFLNKFFKNDKLPPVWHHNGPCIPGVQRLFVNCEGDFYPCEKSFETCDCLKIGNINCGFDMEKINALLNLGNLSMVECNNCWAKRFCNICAIKCVDFENDELSHNQKMTMCKQVKQQTINNLKRYLGRTINQL